MAQVIKPFLHWKPQAEGRCACGNYSLLYHAIEQRNKALSPICAQCLQQVEDQVRERRESKGLNPDATKKV